MRLQVRDDPLPVAFHTPFGPAASQSTPSTSASSSGVVGGPLSFVKVPAPRAVVVTHTPSLYDAT